MIRVLIGGFPNVLREIIVQSIAESPDMCVVGDGGGSDLARAIREQRADVAIVPSSTSELQLRDGASTVPANELLASAPNLLVVGIGPNERAATAEADLLLGDGRTRHRTSLRFHNVAVGQLVAAIRAAARVGALEDEHADASAPPYTNDREYLSDELRRLDLLIRIQLRSDPARARGSRDLPLERLFVAREEVEALLDRDRAPNEELPALFDLLIALDRRIAARRRSSLLDGSYPALCDLADGFGLDAIEERCLLVVLAPHLDARYARVFGYLENDASRRRPGIGLVLRLVCGDPALGLDADAHSRAAALFDPGLRLVLSRLVHRVDTGGADSDPVAVELDVDEGIARRAMGVSGLDPALAGFCRLERWPDGSDAVYVDEATENRLVQLLEQRRATQEQGGNREAVFLHLHGAPGGGRRSLIARACRRLQLPLLRVDAPGLLSGALPPGEAVWRVAREAALEGAALCFEDFSALRESDGARALCEALVTATRLFHCTTFLVDDLPWSPEPPVGGAFFATLAVRAPDARELSAVWESELLREGVELDEDSRRELVSKYRLSPGKIRETIRAARQNRGVRDPQAPFALKDLEAGCRRQTAPALGRFARRLEPRYGWNDLVLPADQDAHLRELASAVRQRSTVIGAWGFAEKLSLGRGLTALFSGPSGCGKTMAAEVLAKELGLECFRIDLASVLSKYIGETEQHLETIFSAAESASAILFFDEADALFGRRSEVRDAHDRYANLEVAFLLQRMEEYSGTAILATNLKKNMDPAFLRRMQFIVDFDLPDAALRERIWRNVFPGDVPLRCNVDYALLAQRLDISGAHIRNISLRAAFAAAEEGRPVAMRHVVAAARREYQKLGRQLEERGLWSCEDLPAA